jgi:hypothetical protein
VEGMGPVGMVDELGILGISFDQRVVVLEVVRIHCPAVHLGRRPGAVAVGRLFIDEYICLCS